MTKQPAAAGTAEPVTSTRRRLLIIEPNALLARQLYGILVPRFDISVVRSAQSAIVSADKAKPDVVVAELQTADASLTGFLHEFRSYAEWRDIPVILYTFSLHVPASVKAILKDRYNVPRVLHKSHVTAAALTEYLDAAAGMPHASPAVQ